MKKMILAVLLGLSGYVGADTSSGVIYLPPTDILMGDAVTRPPNATAGDDTVYLARFLSGTALVMSPTTGVSLTANFLMPTSMKEGDIEIGFTVIYGGVTNSAVVSPTVKVQNTTLYNGSLGTVTATAANFTVLAPVALTDANLYGRYTDVSLGTVSNVYPGDLVAVHLTRSLGESMYLYVVRMWVRFKPNSGWFW